MDPNLNTVLNVFAMLVASYYGCAVLISIVVEIFSQVTGRRARMLRRHLQHEFGSDLADGLLSSPLVAKFDDDKHSGPFWHLQKKVNRLMKGRALPVTYIEPRDFALTMLHVAFQQEAMPAPALERALPQHTISQGGRPPLVPPAIVAETEKLRPHLPPHARELLATLMEGTSGNPAHIQERLEGWFRRDQAQLTAYYGLRSRVWAFLFGTATAVLVNLDTLAIAHVTKLLPSLGYAISGLMISQGASFWFDIVGKVTNLRGGQRPN
jgi:hypothetical protein